MESADASGHPKTAEVTFAHNHPSGVAQPSHADELLTRNLKEALALVEIKVLDHFRRRRQPDAVLRGARVVIRKSGTDPACGEVPVFAYNSRLFRTAHRS